MCETKPFDIPKRLVWEAYKCVKANKGAAGIDGQSIKVFDQDLTNNLYRLWNRLSSGSYFPPPVRAVPIPKKSGGERILGVPTVGDRISQAVATLVLEPLLEPVFITTLTGTDADVQRTMRSRLRASVAGSETGCWSMTSAA